MIHCAPAQAYGSYRRSALTSSGTRRFGNGIHPIFVKGQRRDASINPAPRRRARKELKLMYFLERAGSPFSTCREPKNLPAASHQQTSHHKPSGPEIDSLAQEQQRLTFMQLPHPLIKILIPTPPLHNPQLLLRQLLPRRQPPRHLMPRQRHQLAH